MVHVHRLQRKQKGLQGLSALQWLAFRPCVLWERAMILTSFMVHIICAGTLTLNQLSVDKNSCLVMPGYDLNQALMWGALSANIVSEEPIDMVLHESYDGNKTLWDDWTLEKFVPFNPTDKYTIAVVKNKQSGQQKRIMKGAPQVRPASALGSFLTRCVCSAL